MYMNTIDWCISFTDKRVRVEENMIASDHMGTGVVFAIRVMYIAS